MAIKWETKVDFGCCHGFIAERFVNYGGRFDEIMVENRLVALINCHCVVIMVYYICLTHSFTYKHAQNKSDKLHS